MMASVSTQGPLEETVARQGCRWTQPASAAYEAIRVAKPIIQAALPGEGK